MNNKEPNIVGLIALYKPQKDEMANIEQYIDDLDYCYLLDDSGENCEEVCRCLMDKYPGKVEYYCNPKNIGLVASVNNGFKMAEKHGADWSLVMNPDGTFQTDAIKVFRKYIREHDTGKVGIIAPRFNIDRRPREAGQGYVEIKYADMTGCLYNSKILNELGYYDQNTYFYGLDREYCLRVLKNNYKIIECSAAVLNHRPAETYEVKILGKTVLKCGKDNPQRYYYQFRSKYYIYKKYHNFNSWFSGVTKLLKVVLFFDNKKEYYKMIKLGIYDAKRGFYGNINDRKVL